MVSFAERVTPRYVPEIRAEVFCCRGLVVTVKEMLLAPAGIVADDGTCAV